MSARGFGSVLWAGAVAGAALGFYLVSLRVASERSALEDVESEIAMAQRDIRLLQTEIGTRGRLAQLERWNVKFIRLSAPSADQFVGSGFQLATLVRPEAKPAIEAPVILASAPAAQVAPQPRMTDDGGDLPQASRPVSEMMHVASYSLPTRPAATTVTLAKPNREAAPKPVKSAPSTKPVKSAAADPLAPLSSTESKAKAGKPAATVAKATPVKSKDSVTD